MWIDTVEILAVLGQMPFVGRIGEKIKAYYENENIILEVPEEPKSAFEQGILIFEFGNILEKLFLENGFARRWQKRFEEFCVDEIE